MSTLERWYNKNSMVNEPPQPCNFKVGDSVIFTNENGVEFGPHKVLGFTTPEDVSHGRFIHIDTDCAWFPVSPDSLRPVQPTLLHKESTMTPAQHQTAYEIALENAQTALRDRIGLLRDAADSISRNVDRMTADKNSAIMYFEWSLGDLQNMLTNLGLPDLCRRNAYLSVCKQSTHKE